MANEKRLIDANALSESIKNGSGTQLQKFFADVCVATAPTVDAVEVVHGEWKRTPTSQTLYCGVCDKIPECQIETNYCPNCGAKMDGDGDG